MNDPSPAFGTTRARGPTVSYSEIERAARAVMAAGDRPTGKAVLEHLGRGSPNHINECMRRFWKDQAAINAGDPVALLRLPPEMADAAVAQWEQALRLSQQTAKYEDNEARTQLEQLRREVDVRVRSVELREKEWDMAARVRERALIDTREQVNLLLKELAIANGELRARDLRIATLESEVMDYRARLATVISRAASRSRTRVGKKAKLANRRRSPPKSNRSRGPKRRTRRKSD